MSDCGKCPAKWSGTKVEHCTSCHATFSGTTSGDMHRTGKHDVFVGPQRRRCLTDAEMTQKGLVATVNAMKTPVWGKRQSQEAPFWLTQQESAGLAGVPPTSAPIPYIEALREMEMVE